MAILSDWLDRKSLYIALLAAWVAMLGSLYFSEVAHFVPCVLCWYQRILMYPLTLILTIGLLRKDENLPFFVLPFSGLGLCIAVYHYLLEKTDLFDAMTTCQSGAPCTTAWINWFGFITIPFLSLIGFLVITLMTIIALHAGEPVYEEAAPRPWLAVLGIIVVTLIAFFLLVRINQSPAPATATFPLLTVDNQGSQRQSTITITASITATAGTNEAEARLYAQSCAGCHGAHGEGVASLGPSLAGSTFVQQQSDEALLQFVRKGRAVNDPANQSKLAMPPSGGRPDLSDSELLAIIHYIQDLPAK